MQMYSTWSLLIIFVIPFSSSSSFFLELDSSGEWSPSSSDFSGPPSSWPGQSESFGRQMRRSSVGHLNDLPSVQSFFTDYVKTRQPIVLDTLFREMKSKTDYAFKLSRMIKRGRSALSKVQVEDNDSGQGTAHHMQLRQVAQHVIDKNDCTLKSKYPLHFFLKTQLLMPSVLKCHEVFDRLKDTKHIIVAGHETRHPLEQEKDHKLICQMEGEKEVLMINPEGKLNEKSKEDFHKLDVNNVNFEHLEELRYVQELKVARLESGQCLFVPSNWITQTNVIGLDHGLELRWAAAATPQAEIDELKCERRVSPLMTIGDAAWPRENFAKRPDRTSDRDRKAIDLMSNVIDKYLMSNKKEYDLDAVRGDMRSDTELTSGIGEWNDECDDVAKNVFNLLDLDKNGRLEEADVQHIDQIDDVLHWAGAVFDEHISFSEIGFDLKVDKAVPEEGFGPNTRFPHPEVMIRGAEEEEIKEENERAQGKKLEFRKYGKKNKDEL